MVILSAVIWLPFPLILTLGLIIVLGHNSLDFYESTRKTFSIPYSLLHVQSIQPLGNKVLLIFYPFLPWAGLMMLGYCFGKYYLADIMNRNRRTILLGTGLILFFVALRWTNIYGDPFDWKTQPTALYTFFSFINTQKYPPSLLYLCVTIGPSLIILGLVGDVRSKFAEIITVYGRVPLFYYVIHFYLLHLLSAIMYLTRGHSFDDGLRGVDGVPFKFYQPGEGFGLAVVYIVWLIVVVLLYPLCRWFADYKRQQPKWWLSYL
jgi:uncharacterized membrane protein